MEEIITEPSLAAAREEALAAFMATGSAHRNCSQAVMLFRVVTSAEIRKRSPSPATWAAVLPGPD